MLTYPTTAAGRYKRRQTDLLESISGLKYCTSCNQLKPVAQVKVYRSTNGRGAVPRCNDCMERRRAAMEAIKCSRA